jgi:type IV secretory pathway VirJ component
MEEVKLFTKSDLNQTTSILSSDTSTHELLGASLDTVIAAIGQISKEGQEHDSELEEAVSDLPLIEVFPEKPKDDFLFLFISGDGGWAAIDKDLAESLKSEGMRVLGLNSLRYFWVKKSPDQTAADLNRAIRFYRTKFGIKHIVLMGFSFGADIVPFVANRLSADNKTDISDVVLLSPGKKTDFEIKIADWLGMEGQASAFDITSEISKMNEEDILCIYGAEDGDQGCSLLDPKRFNLTQLPGDHHFDGDYKRVSDLILNAVKEREGRK